MTAISMPLRQCRLTMDLFEMAPPGAPRIFAGFTLGENWNGWACPYFTRDQASALVEGWLALGGQAHYDAASDEFVFSSLEASDQLPERYGPTDVAGQRLYPIGTRAWIWEDVSHPA